MLRRTSAICPSLERALMAQPKLVPSRTAGSSSLTCARHERFESLVPSVAHPVQPSGKIPTVAATGAAWLGRIGQGHFDKNGVVRTSACESRSESALDRRGNCPALSPVPPRLSKSCDVPSLLSPARCQVRRSLSWPSMPFVVQGAGYVPSRATGPIGRSRHDTKGRIHLAGRIGALQQSE
jgi:hypothetical protein